MSYIFETVTGALNTLAFKHNGQFALRNYDVEIVNGNRLKVTSTGNELFSLLEADVSEIEINGTVYSDPAAAQVALQALVSSSAEPVVMTKEMYLELAAAVQVDDRGIILPDTPAPVGGWQPGWYTPGLFENDDPGTNYPLQSNLKAKKGFITKFLLSGGVWDSVEWALPQGSQNLRIYEDIPNGTILNEKEQVISNNAQYIVKDGETAVVGTDLPTGDKFNVVGSDLKLDVYGGALSYDTFVNNEGSSISSKTYTSFLDSTASREGVVWNRFNTQCLQFVSGIGVEKLIVSMTTATGVNSEIGYPIYGKKHDGTFEPIYNNLGVDLTDEEFIVDPTRYLFIYFNADNGFYGNSITTPSITVFTQSSPKAIYAKSEDFEKTKKALDYFLEDSQEEIVAGVAGVYTINGAGYGAGGYIAIYEYPAQGVLAIDFTAKSTGVGNNTVTVYGRKADATYEPIFDRPNIEFVNEIIPIEQGRFTELFVNYRAGAVTPVIKMVKSKDITNAVKNYVDSSGGGSGISVNNTVIFAESLGVNASASASTNTSILNGIFDTYKNTGTTVVLPCGVLNVNNLIVPNTISLLGSGRHWKGTILRGSTAGNTIEVTKHYNGDMMGSIGNMMIDGQAIATNLINITTPGLAFFKLHDLFLIASTGWLLETTGALIFNMERIRFSGNTANGWKMRGGGGYQANHIILDSCQFGGIQGVACDLNGGANIVFNNCDWEANGTSGNVNTGNVKASGLSPLGEGVDLTFNNCWSEICYGGFWLDLSGAQGVTTFRDSMIWQVGGDAQVGIKNNGAKVLITGSTKIQGWTTGVQSSNNGEVRLDGFASVNSHTEASGATYKSVTYS